MSNTQNFLSSLSLDLPSALSLLQSLLDAGDVTTQNITSALSLSASARASQEDGERPRKKAKVDGCDDDDDDLEATVGATAEATTNKSKNKNKNKNKKTKPPRTFDLSTRRSRHIALRISYDGETYGGFSENVGEAYDNSVEKALFEALVKVRLVADRASCGYSRCGRTDKGVSAAGQVVSLRLRSAFPKGEEYDSRLPKAGEAADVKGKATMELDYCKMLNGVLPEEIRVISWTPVTEEFSSRFSCTARVYRYFFVRRGLDLGRMELALSKIVGDHDFRNIAKMDTEHVSNFRRLIYAAKIVRGGEGGEREQCHFEIKGQAFLWHMVRNIVQVMFFVGKGLEDPSVVDELFDVEKMPRKPNYKMADDFPLVLHRCEFNDLRLVNSPSNLWELQMNMERRWERLALKASQLRNQIESLGVENHVGTDELWDFAKESLGKWRRVAGAEAKAGAGQAGAEAGEGTGKVTWKRALELLKEREGVVISGYKEPPHAKLCDRKVGLSYEEKLGAMTGKKLERYNAAQKKGKEAAEAGGDKAFYKLKQQQGTSTS